MDFLPLSVVSLESKHNYRSKIDSQHLDLVQDVQIPLHKKDRMCLACYFFGVFSLYTIFYTEWALYYAIWLLFSSFHWRRVGNRHRIGHVIDSGSRDTTGNVCYSYKPLWNSVSSSLKNEYYDPCLLYQVLVDKINWDKR